MENYYDQILSKTISIRRPPSKVWEALTNLNSMRTWMSESKIEIITDWEVGSPITIQGELSNIPFENKGVVLGFEPESLLRYSHLSSLSMLDDHVKSYSVIEFRLTENNNLTILTFTMSNFPTEIIYKHLAFYWNSTLQILKEFIELGHV
jgi:uncharacterized protein YndB with AHSA1/START domain